MTMNRFQPERASQIGYVSEDWERRTGQYLAEGDERDEFERDRSRIIHSTAFRRLSGKTQALAVGHSDFFRSRLTHSLEVAQIAKGLALRYGAQPEICEAVALAHDIGHPPFGHSGEKVLQELMAEHCGYEANAQNFRILCMLEAKSASYTGLDLTRAVLDTLFKYKSPFPDRTDKFHYTDDTFLVETLAWVKVGGDEQALNVDYADDIAYAVHDLEDGLHAGMIDSRRAYQHTSEILRQAQEYESGCTEKDILWAIARIAEIDSYESENLTYSDLERKTKRKQLTSDLIGRFIRAAERVDRPGEWETERYKKALRIPVTTRREVAALKAVNFRLIIEDERG